MLAYFVVSIDKSIEERTIATQEDRKLEFEDHKRLAAILFLAFLCGLIGWHRHTRREIRNAAEDAAFREGYIVSP